MPDVDLLALEYSVKYGVGICLEHALDLVLRLKAAGFKVRIDRTEGGSTSGE